MNPSQSIVTDFLWREGMSIGQTEDIIPLTMINQSNVSRIHLADLNKRHHCKAILQLLEAFALEPMSGGMGISTEVRDTIVPGLAAQPGSRVFLAKSGDKYVGTAICFLGFSSFQAKPLINIHDLVVLSTHRGRGIGGELIAAVSDYGVGIGCCKVTLEVREDNLNALHLYRRKGFRSGNEEESVRLLYMQKPL